MIRHHHLSVQEIKIADADVGIRPYFLDHMGGRAWVAQIANVPAATMAGNQGFGAFSPECDSNPVIVLSVADLTFDRVQNLIGV